MRVVWDDPQSRFYDTGVSKGVLFAENAPGVPWNGLISVTESPDQSQEPRYFDGLRYVTRNLSASFAGIISAYTYPDEFESCVGTPGVLTGQPRRPFGFSFRTNRELHIVYNALVAPSKRDNKTVSENPSALAFEWGFTTLPEKIPGGKPSSHLVVMVDYVQPEAISALEDFIYGNDEDDPSLPEPEDLIELFEANALMQVIDNGDNTFTVIGPDNMVSMVDANTFQIVANTVVILGDGTFRVSSQ